MKCKVQLRCGLDSTPLKVILLMEAPFATVWVRLPVTVTLPADCCVCEELLCVWFFSDEELSTLAMLDELVLSLLFEDVSTLAEESSGRSAAEETPGSSFADERTGSSFAEDISGSTLAEDNSGGSAAEEIPGSSFAEEGGIPWFNSSSVVIFKSFRSTAMVVFPSAPIMVPDNSFSPLNTNVPTTLPFASVTMPAG